MKAMAFLVALGAFLCAGVFAIMGLREFFTGSDRWSHTTGILLIACGKLCLGTAQAAAAFWRGAEHPTSNAQRPTSNEGGAR